MDVTTTSAATITCAKPACGAPTTLAESIYIDGCGQVCTGCAGPSPRGWTTWSPRTDRTATVLTGRPRHPVSRRSLTSRERCPHPQADCRA